MTQLTRASQPLFRKIEGTVKVAELGADGNSNRLPRTATFIFLTVLKLFWEVLQLTQFLELLLDF